MQSGRGGDDFNLKLKKMPGDGDLGMILHWNIQQNNDSVLDHSRGEKEHWTKEGILENNHLRGDGEGSQK